jgi:hypothetical protein
MGLGTFWISLYRHYLSHSNHRVHRYLLHCSVSRGVASCRDFVWNCKIFRAIFSLIVCTNILQPWGVFQTRKSTVPANFLTSVLPSFVCSHYYLRLRSLPRRAARSSYHLRQLLLGSRPSYRHRSHQVHVASNRPMGLPYPLLTPSMYQLFFAMTYPIHQRS